MAYLETGTVIEELTVPVSFSNMIHLEKFGSKSK